MKDTTKRDGFRSTRAALRGLAAVAALAVGVAGCRDVLLTDPAPAAPVVLDLAPLLSTGPGAAPAAEVLQSADNIRVLITADGASGPLVDRQVDLATVDGRIEARVEIPLDGESVTAHGEFLVRDGGATLFFAQDVFTLTQGERTVITPDLDPEVHQVQVATVPPVTALGTSVAIDATATYAGGTVIDEATFTYQSSNPSVLSPLGGNEFEAVGEGTATITATASAGASELDTSNDSGSVQVTVQAEVASLEADPTSLALDVDETGTLHVTATDASGNVLDRDITFTSSNDAVATVAATGDATAEVTGQSQGSADITASTGDVSVVVPVTVTQPLGTGDVQVTLTWDNTADLDLYVTDPAGSVIWYGSPTSPSGGMLDVDDTDGFGPENIFWPEGGAPEGTYSVEVNHFAGPAPAQWQVTVLTPDGTTTYDGSISSEQTVEVTNFTVGTPTPTCPSQGTVALGQSVSGTISSGDCAYPNVGQNNLGRAWEITPGTEAIVLDLVEASSASSPLASLWRAGAGSGGRVGIATSGWGATVIHLDPSATYTLTVEGEPGESFHLNTAAASGEETSGSPDIIQWSEPVTGRMLSITSDDPLNPFQEHEDNHAFWPAPNTTWTVEASSENQLRNRDPAGENDEIGTTVGITFSGFSVSGRVFYLASYQNEGVPQPYSLTISESSAPPGSSAEAKRRAVTSPASSPHAVVGSEGR